MKYITDKEYNSRMRRIKARNVSKERERKLKEEKRKSKIHFKMPTTSKIVLMAMILLCVQIIVFCEYMMYKSEDLSAMYALIGIPASLSCVIWGYYSKSKAQNTVGGITYEMAMANINENTEESNDETTEEGLG